MIRFLATLLGLAGCGMTTASNTDPDVVSYRRDVQPIWDRWCNRCHNFHTPHLTAAESAHDLTTQSWFKCRQGSEHAPFIVPGDPDASFLVYKLTGEHAEVFWEGEACNRLMPADVSGRDVPLIQLDPEAVDLVRRWIEAGARFDES